MTTVFERMSYCLVEPTIVQRAIFNPATAIIGQMSTEKSYPEVETPMSPIRDRTIRVGDPAEQIDS